MHSNTKKYVLIALVVAVVLAGLAVGGYYLFRNGDSTPSTKKCSADADCTDGGVCMNGVCCAGPCGSVCCSDNQSCSPNLDGSTTCVDASTKYTMYAELDNGVGGLSSKDLVASTLPPAVGNTIGDDPVTVVFMMNLGDVKLSQVVASVYDKTHNTVYKVTSTGDWASGTGTDPSVPSFVALAADQTDPDSGGNLMGAFVGLPAQPGSSSANVNIEFDCTTTDGDQMTAYLTVAHNV